MTQRALAGRLGRLEARQPATSTWETLPDGWRRSTSGPAELLVPPTLEADEWAAEAAAHYATRTERGAPLHEEEHDR